MSVHHPHDNLDYLFKNNYLSNQFLFGEDIQVEQPQFKKDGAQPAAKVLSEVASSTAYSQKPRSKSQGKASVAGRTKTAPSRQGFAVQGEFDNSQLEPLPALVKEKSNKWSRLMHGKVPD